MVAGATSTGRAPSWAHDTRADGGGTCHCGRHHWHQGPVTPRHCCCSCTGSGCGRLGGRSDPLLHRRCPDPGTTEPHRGHRGDEVGNPIRPQLLGLPGRGPRHGRGAVRPGRRADVHDRVDPEGVQHVDGTAPVRVGPPVPYARVPHRPGARTAPSAATSCWWPPATSPWACASSPTARWCSPRPRTSTTPTPTPACRASRSGTTRSPPWTTWREQVAASGDHEGQAATSSSTTGSSRRSSAGRT